jgi:hypothetical protein
VLTKRKKTFKVKKLKPNPPKLISVPNNLKENPNPTPHKSPPPRPNPKSPIDPPVQRSMRMGTNMQLINFTLIHSLLLFILFMSLVGGRVPIWEL